MNQQINLYQPIFRRERHVFGAYTMAKAASLVVVALVGFYIFGLVEVMGLESEVRQLEAREQSYSAQLQRIAAGTSGQQTATIDDELKLLNRQLADKQRLVEVLRTQQFGKTIGFSARLKALAEHTVDGVWLTRIIADGGSQGLYLRGESIHEELIPAYLRSLSEAADLDGLLFDSLRVERNEENNQRITFTVASRGVTEEAGDDRR